MCHCQCNTIDICLQVYLMEANMSPNLSSAHFPPNRKVTNVQNQTDTLEFWNGWDHRSCFLSAGYCTSRSSTPCSGWSGSSRAPSGTSHPGLRQVKGIQSSDWSGSSRAPSGTSHPGLRQVKGIQSSDWSGSSRAPSGTGNSGLPQVQVIQGSVRYKSSRAPSGTSHPGLSQVQVNQGSVR